MDNLAEELKNMGGYLKCEICDKTKSLGNVENKLCNGWDKCCGYTMRWITQKEINQHKM